LLDNYYIVKKQRKCDTFFINIANINTGVLSIITNRRHNTMFKLFKHSI